MRGDIRVLRGLAVSAAALLLLVGGVTAANIGGRNPAWSRPRRDR